MASFRAFATIVGAVLALGAGGCATLPPPPIASESRGQPLFVDVLSDRIQCELAAIYRLPEPLARDMDNFVGAVDLELKVVERIQAGASGSLAVAFSGGRVAPSLGLSGSRDATRSGQIRFNVLFRDLRSNPCARGEGLRATSTGWPEAAGTLGLSSWLTTAISAVARPAPDSAGLVQLDYTLQFDVLTEALAGFRIAPVNVVADIGASGKSQTTNRMVVAIRRLPGDPTPQLVRIVNWDRPAITAARGPAAVRGGRAPQATRISPSVERMLDQQLRDSINRVTPQLLRTTPFIN